MERFAKPWSNPAVQLVHCADLMRMIASNAGWVMRLSVKGAPTCRAASLLNVATARCRRQGAEAAR